MKNLLLVLPLSIMMTYSSAQDVKQEKEKSDAKEVKEKTSAINSLDGKAFKITLALRNTEELKGSSVKSDGMSKKESSEPGTGKDVKQEGVQPAPVDNSVAPPPTGNQPPQTTDPEMMTAPVTPGNTAVATEVPAPVQGNLESLLNKKIIVRFENGMIHSAELASNGIENCNYKVSSAEATIKSFTSNCRGSSGNVKGMWSGIVDANNIRGNLTITSSDGIDIYYVFKGSAATQKELDAARELGMK